MKSIRHALYVAVRATATEAVELQDELAFVGDLGYDSLRIANLAIALESNLGRPILLNDWLALADDLDSLTIGSLLRYLQDVSDGGM